ncbi:Os03g0660000 [Oryza sativa Japonica Group]|uniref:Os03g0660000 protein n=3 Tax=Oryza sativa TaxID=4530 RepID=B9FA53_ORYSJ|nr:expressed protein [Oryza sativa Japonica Group]EEC75864.1 hypothetical protein OsI_12878 [Oryza sativa Indica Group]KAB8092880.1 hypothetical protein EE612_019418 [Oryza sativa]EEE59631.1 hypothetical protein OsJ_11979 [Oryza sativa Japonica Group]KAF2940519.1 hypothetical protein DAI22_03g180400 [Oryza sativa Japonica Group]|eukprot:NP_001050823.1 Os03g0660000 [Oryza sativa Japonica Group]
MLLHGAHAAFDCSGMLPEHATVFALIQGYRRVAVYSSRATNKGEQPPRSAHPRIHPLLCRRPTGLLATSALAKPGRCGARPRQPTATPFCAASPLSLPATAPASVLGT